MFYHNINQPILDKYLVCHDRNCNFSTHDVSLLDTSRTETTFQEQKQIVSLHNQCKSAYQIARLVGRPRSTIQTIIDRFSVYKTFENKSRSGRPRALSLQNDRLLVR